MPEIQEIKVVVNQLEEHEKVRDASLHRALDIIDRTSQRFETVTKLVIYAIIILFITLTITAIFTN